MKQLSAEDLQTLSRAWEEYVRAAAGPSQRRSRLRLWLVFLLVRHGGLRLSEALDLDERRDLDPAACVLRAAGREVPLPARVMARVQRLVSLEELAPLAGRVTRLDQGHVRRHFYAVAAGCGLDPEAAGPRALRRARAAELVRAGIPESIVRTVLGQRAAGQTADLAGFTDEDARRIVHSHLQREALRRSSARNALTGTVTRVVRAAVSALVELATLDGQLVQALVTIESADRLKMRPGQLLTATVKAPFIQLSLPSGADFSLPNRFPCQVTEISRGPVESSVQLSAGPCRFCALVATEELERLGLAPGENACVAFSPFCAVLTLPDEISEEH